METNFNSKAPHILIVDDFYKNPDEVRREALSKEFVADERYYKGKRTRERLLLPYVKEEFERLLGLRITDWLNQPCNGTFQITTKQDPLVWHSDLQDYAAAIYLTADANDLGTSFWQDKKYGCRRAPNHPLENKNIEYGAEIYSEYNLLHPDNWELIDKVGAVYNRLVIWDAKLIHSASMYSEQERLVQLFFFSTKEL